MDWWLTLWHNLTPAQGTLLGGLFILIAAVVAFGTGSLDRRTQATRFHYGEMKTLYAEALRIGRDLELLKAVPPEERDKILAEKVPAMQRVISELALTGNYQTADLAIEYTYQQSVQLARWSREVENDADWPGQLRLWVDNLTQDDRSALEKYENVTINRRDVVQALRQELALFVPRGSRYRRVMRRPTGVDRYVLN
jgi:hypothetical protein